MYSYLVLIIQVHEKLEGLFEWYTETFIKNLHVHHGEVGFIQLQNQQSLLIRYSCFLKKH
jgi:hypothetical protein